MLVWFSAGFPGCMVLRLILVVGLLWVFSFCLICDGFGWAVGVRVWFDLFAIGLDLDTESQLLVFVCWVLRVVS